MTHPLTRVKTSSVQLHAMRVVALAMRTPDKAKHLAQDACRAKLGLIESRLKRYRLEEVQERNAAGECWLILDGVHPPCLVQKSATLQLTAGQAVLGKCNWASPTGSHELVVVVAL